jgi:hypothetical protein
MNPSPTGLDWNGHNDIGGADQLQPVSLPELLMRRCPHVCTINTHARIWFQAKLLDKNETSNGLLDL